ncbi:MAG: DUF3343 domain-containing protein [Clostridia bacterium]|nr:DUF3343 domain-containing protein [Clostridia bacterium]
MEHYYLYTFESTHGAIAAQKLLKDRMQATIMPVLREINASCGISVRIPVEGYEESLQLMQDNMEGDFSLYHVDGKEITCLIKEEEK